MLDGLTSIGWLEKTYIYQVSAETGCYLDELLRAMADRDRRKERIKGICAESMPWRWCYMDGNIVCLHMDEQRQDNQLEPSYKSSVLIQDVALKTYQEAMDNNEGWHERVKDIHAGGATWW